MGAPAAGAIEASRSVHSGGVDLAVYEWGAPAAGRPTVVLVHGYPDTASVWRRTAEILAERYHVVAYDVRGAGRSTRPDHRRAYDLEHLVGDLKAVVDAVRPEAPVHLVCHDWGSIQCWEAVTTDTLTGRIASFTSMSGPSIDHAAYWIMNRLKSGSPTQLAQVARQLAHSWYIGLFQLPALAPGLWKAGLDKLWPTILEKVEGVAGVEPNPTQRDDGAHGVNLYRANFPQRLFGPQRRNTELPVQLIFPRRDKFMVAEIWDDLPQWAPKLWRRDVDAGHWLQISHPQTVARMAGEFIDFVESGKEPAALQRARVRPERQGLPHSGQLVVITGAGSGFGRATALAFAEQGADLVCVDIDGEAAERTAELCRLLKAQAWARAVDVADAGQMGELAAWVESGPGAPDVVVNNAGIGMAGSFFDTTDADWERVLKVNLWGVIHGSRLFGRQMLSAGKRGHIVNVASMGAYTPQRAMAAYNTSKAAVRMLSDCLRAELAESGIHVSTICPGVAITNITRTTRFVGSSPEDEARQQKRATAIYQRRNLQPEAIAGAILDAVSQRRDEVPVGAEAHGARLVSRLAPGLARRFARLKLAP